LAEFSDQGMAVHALDVTDTKGIKTVVARVAGDEGGIDILVSNAGYGLMGPSVELPLAAVQHQFDTNIIGVLSMVQAVAPVMKAAGQGIIVNMGSVSGVAVTPFAGAYCASKAALHAFSDAMRMGLAPFGITVVTVQLGAVRSRFGDRAHDELSAVISPDSWYLPVKAAMAARAKASQKGATPADDCAGKLVAEILSPGPGPVVRVGKISRVMPLMKKWLPIRLLDRIFASKFGLGKDSALNQRQG